MQNKYEEEDIVTVKISEQCSVKMVGLSIVGTREYQQDAYYMSSTNVGTLAIICDGMGGTEHGEIASLKAIETLVTDFESLTSISNPSDFLLREILKINDEVFALKDDEGKQIDCGSTLIAVLTVGNAAYWISVGDSRIFVLRDGNMIPVNRLHNYRMKLDEQLEKRLISKEDYLEEEKQAEALISYIGMDELELIDRNTEPFGMRYQDKFLLCSDGLYKVLNQEQIQKIVNDNSMNIGDAVLSLIKCVKNSCKKNIDNTTVVLMSYE